MKLQPEHHLSLLSGYMAPLSCIILGMGFLSVGCLTGLCLVGDFASFCVVVDANIFLVAMEFLLVLVGSLTMSAYVALDGPTSGSTEGSTCVCTNSLEELAIVISSIAVSRMIIICFAPKWFTWRPSLKRCLDGSML